MIGLVDLGLSLAFLVVRPEGHGSISGAGLCTEAASKICEALRKEDAGLRVGEGRSAIREALFSTDQEVREASVRLLSALADRVDLRPFAGIFKEFCRTVSKCFWTPEKEDDSELRFGAREIRIQIFERAIRSGGTVLAHGTSLQRWRAVHWAAWQGLDELAPLAARTYASGAGSGDSLGRWDCWLRGALFG